VRVCRQFETHKRVPTDFALHHDIRHGYAASNTAIFARDAS
jgi:hypothetical protein